MSRPSLTQASQWRPEALRGLADAWDETARVIHANVVAASRAGQDTGPAWAGAGGDAARHDAKAFALNGDAVARALVLAAVAARDGSEQIEVAKSDVAARVDAARAEGFLVGDDGSVEPDAPPSTLLITLSGNDVGVAAQMLIARATVLSGQIADALDRLGAADGDAALDVRAALESVSRTADTALGNTDGVPWDVRIAANRTNAAQAIVEHLGDRTASTRNGFYRGLLAEVDDPAGSGQRIDRKILAFDPGRASLV
ncbi:MAG: alpha/beta hydrolase, partial [Mycobacterium sp.]